MIIYKKSEGVIREKTENTSANISISGETTMGRVRIIKKNDEDIVRIFIQSACVCTAYRDGRAAGDLSGTVCAF